jgi:hypothetical protein
MNIYKFDLQYHGIINYIAGDVRERVDSSSTVVGSITEITGNNGQPFLGDAKIGIYSIAPNGDGQGNILVKFSIEWDSDLWVRLTLVTLP